MCNVPLYTASLFSLSVLYSVAEETLLVLTATTNLNLITTYSDYLTLITTDLTILAQ